MPGRVASRRVEAYRVQVIDQPVSRLDAIIRVGGIGRDALDTQQAEQALHRVIDRLIDVRKNLVDLTHGVGHVGHGVGPPM